MNLIDKTIGWFSPEAGLRRAKARVVLGGIAQLAYEGAKAGRRTGGWIRPGSSANSETFSGLKTLRDGARDLVRNNSQASSAMLQFQTKLVGTGIRPQAKTGDVKLNQKLDETFETWAKQTRYYQMQALAARTIPESGEAVLRFRPRRKEDGLVVPLAFSLLEPDYIDHLRTEPIGTGYVIQGVEYDLLDREVALWLWPWHPGDTINAVAYRRQNWSSNRVPVATDNPLDGIVRGYRVDRPGQVRGVSWFAPVMTALWDLAGYEEAERVRKRIEACLAAFVTTPVDSDGATPLAPQTRDSDTGITTEEFRPGLINRLRPGEDVKIAEPKAAGGYIDYTRRQDRLIAVGLGLLYELLSGDLSQVNYSSYRGGLVGLRDWIEFLQWHLIVPFCCDPVWTRFVAACKIAGIVPPDTPATVEWGPPYFDLLDREAEAKADNAEIRNGTATWDQTVTRRGLDPNKQTEQIEARNKDFDSKGIILDCDPRVIGRGGAMQTNPPEQLPAP